MKFTAAAIVALCGLSASDAFVIPPPFNMPQNYYATTTRTSTTTAVSTKMADDGFSDDFKDALKDKSSSDGEEEAVGSGSSRFKELLKAAQSSGGAEGARMPVAIENPFLNPTPPPPPSQPLASTPNPEDLSVEEQARMFREMMAQQQGAAVAMPPPPQPMDAPKRVSKTDRAGRPVGRNRDADTIANAADLYFAQLKRDSSVRTMARLHGEVDIAERVFEDEGIKQLEGLLKQNPHLMGHREKEMQLIEEVPEEALAPYFRSDELSEEEKAKSGPSYKKKLMERKQALKGGNAVASAPPAQEAPTPVATASVRNDARAAEMAPVENVAPPSVVLLSPELVTTPPVETVTPTPSQSAAGPAMQPNPDETRQKIRTLMGMILKHRGGPGFGKGRLKGPEIDRFDNLLSEVTDLLREEAKYAHPVNIPLASTTPIEDTVAYQTHAAAITQPQPSVESQPTSVASTSTGASTDINSMIACIEGAVTMYKNSPPALQQNVLVTLRAALVSAVDTCNSILSSEPPPAIGANPDGRIDNTIAVIEGAITMYKNSPPVLKDSVLVTLRAALISAVETCSLVVDGDQTVAVSQSVQEQPRAVSAPNAVSIIPIAPPESVSPLPTAPVKALDPNSQKLERIYESLKASAGGGRLGLRNDITPDEAKELADQLIEMRSTLMKEIEIVPILKPATESQSTGSAPKYQQMLAEARAKKAEG